MQKKIKVGFFPAHPAQFLMMQALAQYKPSDTEIVWFIRDKDVTKQLADESGIKYEVVSKAQSGLLGNAFELFKNIFNFIKLSRKKNIDVWFSKYGAVNIASWTLRIPNLSFNDDDEDLVPLIAMTSYPFATKVLCTNWTRTKRFKKNVVHYNSFHELFYLHPRRFTLKKTQQHSSSVSLPNQPYILIRLSSLQAHHDVNVKGISLSMLAAIILKFKDSYQIYISSEARLPQELIKYELNINASDVHQVLGNAHLFISDSQTMTAEAALLGVRNLRISSFSKKIGYLDALEVAGLSWSILPDTNCRVLSKITEVIEFSNNSLLENKDKLIKQTIDPVPYFWSEIIKTVKHSKK